MRYYTYFSSPSPEFVGPYTAGDIVPAQRGNPGWEIPRLAPRAEPQWGLYEAIEGASAPSPYHIADDPPIVLSFEGAEGTPAGRVRETNQWVEMPIADLYAMKQAEIASQDRQVRYNAVDSSLSVNWWLIVTQDMRFELDGIQGNWLQRQIDSLAFPGGPNQPWVGIYNAATGDARRYQVDETTWRTLYAEKTEHDQATGNATNASGAALDAAYADGAGNWQTVADHDPADPAWGYPPTVQLSASARARFG